MDQRPIAAVVAVMIILGLSAWVFSGDEDVERENLYNPSVGLPGQEIEMEGEDAEPQYMILVDEPTSEEELLFVAALSSIGVHNNIYHPMFILEEGQLDEHQLWTINHMENSDVPKLIFTNFDDTEAKVKEQLSSGNITRYKATEQQLGMFFGFDGVISVESYKEALWVAPLANIENKAIIVGESTFNSQEEVWDVLLNKGHNANYVIVTNPEDYQDENVFYSVITDNDGNQFEDSYHIPTISAVAAELAAYHKAFVLTDIPVSDNFSEEFNDVIATKDVGINNKPISTLLMLREINEKYGPIEYINLVGSAEAVPHFDLPDYSNSEPDYTSCDVLYAFLDDDPFTMDAAIGRIINYNVQGASNQIVRTLNYQHIVEEVTSETDEGSRTKKWREHGSSWNGYEVADARLQNTPGVFFQQDMEDEGYTCDYITTAGAGSKNNGEFASNFRGILETSGMVAYRGHGSWHGSLYTWGYFVNSGANVAGMGDDDRGHLEGTHARELFMPPLTSIIVSCENTKVHGLSYGGDPIDMDRDFATNFLYGGAIALVGATEVSYSNVGQDGWVILSPGTGSSEWDLNDLWYAAFWDNVLDGSEDFSGSTDNPKHSELEVDNGKAVQYAENRYMAEHPGISPLIKPDGDNGAHWKEAAMFCLLGDPAFTPYQNSPGPKDFDPWH